MSRKASPLSYRYAPSLNLWAGYLRAVERFRAQDYASPHRAHSDWRAQSLAKSALFEALNWTDVIDDYLRKGPSGNLDTQREDWADKLPSDDRDLVMAFRIARNVVHHDWINAVATQNLPRQTRWIWSGLPDPLRPRRPRAQAEADAYGRRVQGRHVLTTLDDMARTLWRYLSWRIVRTEVEQPGHTVGSPVTSDDETPQ